MDVKNIIDMKGDVALTIVPGATIDEASKMLRENYIGAIVVADDAGRVAGILSERDIAVALPQYGGALGETLVSEVMTEDVIFCVPEMTVKQVLDLMVTNGIRHLPVLDGEKLSGVISLRNDDNSPNPYIPIIMLTGHGDRERVCEARDAGVNVFMAKPVSAKALYERLVWMINHPLPFIRTSDYFGPDRRRKDIGPPNGVERRADALDMMSNTG